VDDDARRALSDGARQILGRPLSPTEESLFDRYLNLLIKWSSVHRLVGWTEPRWIIENVFLDSLLFLRVLPESARSLMDLGSGAGVPGVPIKIVRPHLETTLLEARERRASFLSTVVRELGLSGLTVVRGRAESVAPEYRGAFDVVVMRCAGDPVRLMSIAARLVKAGGHVVASGPPQPGALARGEWVVVEGRRPGLTRRFAVITEPKERPAGN
jgi:16S rRNA (guanine527-N7)-methyltransferase